MPPIHVSPGFTWTSLFTGAGAAGIFGIIGLIIRQVGPWAKQATEARESDFKRLRADVDRATAAAERASAAAQRLENMVACMRPAISILTAEVRRLDPDSATNAAIIQVHELMAMAAAGDMGLARGMIGLAAVVGPGEPTG